MMNVGARIGLAVAAGTLGGMAIHATRPSDGERTTSIGASAAIIGGGTLLGAMNLRGATSALVPSRVLGLAGIGLGAVLATLGVATLVRGQFGDQQAPGREWAPGPFPSPSPGDLPTPPYELALGPATPLDVSAKLRGA
jgi:hypothetical protein